MRALLLLSLTACAAASSGQKVRVLLLDEQLDCVAPEEGAPAVAELDLGRDDELYVAEVVDLARGVRVSVPVERDGRHLTFLCPEGLGAFTVRRAIILTNEATQPLDTPAPPARTR
ncbi:MAG TPA: hypothetical protein PKA64_17890 [Myxococcota bacterium]|nr:hypothetical protein [Myxococcota bacterium]